MLADRHVKINSWISKLNPSRVTVAEPAIGGTSYKQSASQVSKPL